MKQDVYQLLFTLTIGIMSCDDESSTKRITSTYDNEPFANIEHATSSNIRLIQANYFQVVVEGQERDVHDTDVSVANNWLIIEEHGTIDEDQVIKIYVPELLELHFLGSSDVFGETKFHQNGNMDLRLYGSGEIDMFVAVDNLDILSGSGDFYLEGLADNVDIDLTGRGWVRAFNLLTDFTDVFLSGSGSAEVTADNDLDILVSGSGNVYYKGHPQIDDQVTGSEQVINAN
jgi:hypothetical protein